MVCELHLDKAFTLKMYCLGASLVAQWQRTHLPI